MAEDLWRRPRAREPASSETRGGEVGEVEVCEVEVGGEVGGLTLAALGLFLFFLFLFSFFLFIQIRFSITEKVPGSGDFFCKKVGNLNSNWNSNFSLINIFIQKWSVCKR